MCIISCSSNLFSTFLFLCISILSNLPQDLLCYLLANFEFFTFLNVTELNQRIGVSGQQQVSLEQPMAVAYPPGAIQKSNRFAIVTNRTTHTASNFTHTQCVENLKAASQRVGNALTNRNRTRMGSASVNGVEWNCSKFLGHKLLSTGKCLKGPNEASAGSVIQWMFTRGLSSNTLAFTSNGTIYSPKQLVLSIFDVK